MKTHLYSKFTFVSAVLILLVTNLFAQVIPTITGPTTNGLPATLGAGITTAEYFTDPDMTGYSWTVSSAGTMAPGSVPESILVTWNNPTGQQTVSVTYNENTSGTPAVLIVNYYPFSPAIDPASIPQFVDPLPHFAAGLRVNAKAGGNIFIKTFPVRQIALSKGTVVTGGTIGDPTTPDAGKANYAGYGISLDGINYPVRMWPAQTIEAQQGKPVTVKYENGLSGITYDQFNILADQTLMTNGYTLNGNPLTDPYRGDIPMVVHLHGGEMPSGSDGGPTAWFTPGYKQTGPGFAFNQSSSSYYPNSQEAATLWYHPHDDGLTRINVYTGLAGYYFLRGANEEAAKLPGWSQDDLVRETTPAGAKYAATFNGSNSYLPEIEIAIQDRMFNVDGGLYWPVAPTNPGIHPFWTPEFVGDVMTVNGKSWPYLSVAPRKYRFRMLEGCNARFLNMWLADASGAPGPAFKIVGGEGGLLGSPAIIDPAQGDKLLMAPGQRYDVVIDFTGMEGKTFTLMNDAGAPYPGGEPVVPGLTDRIMQFIVNGKMVSAANTANAGVDKSQLPSNLRPVTPLVKLTDFAGKLNVNPDVHRQIILNEVSADGGPAAVMVNNTYFDAALSINPADPYRAGGPSEFQTEGTTELFEVINTTADAHPIHIHLLQWQLVSRRAIDDAAYLSAYASEWNKTNPGVAEYPTGLGYPGGAGTPYPYHQVNADNAIGGNPAVSPFFAGPVIPANQEEMGWKDNVIVKPGEVTTFMVRVAPTEKPLNTAPKDLLFPFDPSEGPGYVWHCHIIDHEDMSMMRPLPIVPSPLRYPQITQQPQPAIACLGDVVKFSVTATSNKAITYVWKVSTNGGTSWTPLVNDAVYSGVGLSSLSIKTAAATAPLTGNLYLCDLTNINGLTTSSSAMLTVNNCSVSGTLKYNNQAQNPISGAVVSIGGSKAKTDALGAFTVKGVKSGALPVTISHGLPAGGINSTDAGSITAWSGTAIPTVTYLAGDVDKAGLGVPDAQAIVKNFVSGKDFAQAPWVYSNAEHTTSVIPPALSVTVNGTSVTGFGIHARATGDFNGSYSPVTPGVSTLVLAPSGVLTKVPVAAPFNLPINSVSAMQVGAISLTLNVPSYLVKVNSVSVAGSNTPATWNFVGDKLKIGWYSSIPVNIPTGGNLVVLNLTPTRGFTSTDMLKITMGANCLNELADGLFVPVANGSLTVDNIKVTSKVSTTTDIQLTISPNPAPRNSSVTITYTLPSAGTLSLGIYDSRGQLIKSLIRNQNTNILTNTMSVSLNRMMQGNYFLNLTLVSGGVPQTVAVKFVIK